MHTQVRIKSPSFGRNGICAAVGISRRCDSHLWRVHVRAIHVAEAMMSLVLCYAVDCRCISVHDICNLDPKTANRGAANHVSIFT